MESIQKIKMGEAGNKLICTRQDKKWMEVEDIVTNILLRLPVKSIVICKSVSKHWRRLICSSNFIRLQLNRSKENPGYIVYPHIDYEWNTHFMKFDGDNFEKITLPGCERLYLCNMICSFNGLICWTNYSTRYVSDAYLEIQICNPATREVLLLPKAPQYKKWAQIGVAFGPQINEYKVYRFFYEGSKSQDKHCECEVYSSMTRSWKGIGSVAHSPMSSNHISINGIVYWFMSSEKGDSIPGSILAIDMEENFIRISLPREVTKHIFFVDLDGCLSLVSAHVDVNRFDIWVLKDGNESIWVRKCSNIMPIIKIGHLFSVAARKNEILFILAGRRYLVYSMDNKTWMEPDWVDVFCRSFPTALAFTESLLPCSELICS